jgi:glycosyltransferase involved in cell wall biosynthesis
MRNQKISIWIHTSAPAPYRRHLFEKIAKIFPNTKVFFSLNMQHPWYRYRAWDDNVPSWQVQCINLRKRIPLPSPHSHLNPGLISYLLTQPENTIHLVGSVHANWLLLMPSCILFRGKYVIWNDGGFLEGLQNIEKSLWYRYLRKHVAAAFTPGIMGHKFSCRLGVPESRIYNSYFSHDIDDFATFYYHEAAIRRQNKRKQLRIPPSQIVVLCISRFLKWKRLSDLADALVMLEQKHPSLSDRLSLILIGDGTDREHEPVLKKLQRIRVIHETKVPYEEIKEWYSAADIFLFPSEGDIWGLVVNEALSLGLPVICTDVIGASELVKDGWNGFLVKPRSPGGIMMWLKKMAMDPALLNKMKKNAITIHETWNSDRAVSELERLVADITITDNVVKKQTS